jgi:hypothetical protein
MTNRSVSAQVASGLIDCHSDSAWDTFILASPQCNPFSLSGYLDGLGAIHDKLFFEMDGQIVASALIMSPGDSEFRAP